MRTCAVGLVALWFIVPAALADERLSIARAERDGDGFLVHQVRSANQSAETKIRVLLPDQFELNRKYCVVYVLPVEAGDASRYGDGMREVRRLQLHNALGLIFVGPTFADLPWYADHPTRSDLRQERYFLQEVVLFLDRTYPVVTETKGRFLLGFSKSGWGAWSLLLRHPDRFHRAVAWDAPLMMDRPGKFGSGDLFGTQDNFEAYRISRLLRANVEKVRTGKRLLLLGYGSFRTEHEQAHALLQELRVEHVYRDGPARKHDWHSGWVREAVELLVGE